MKLERRHTRASALIILFVLLSGGLAANCAGALKSRQPIIRTVEPVTAVRCGKLLDVETGRLLSGAVILVRGDRIVAAGQLPPPERM